MSTHCNLYDDHYLRATCGQPYDRTPEWLDFFRSIAERIVRHIPVDAHRHCGTHAFYVHLSDYPEHRLRHDVRPSDHRPGCWLRRGLPHCWVGSIVQPFPQPYHLIVCIEVLEHLLRREAAHPVADLARPTDDILFSSTTFEPPEPAHRGVRPAGTSSDHVARLGFYSNVAFDTSFVARRPAPSRCYCAPIHSVIADYPLRFSLPCKENLDLRSLTLQQRRQLSHHHPTIAALQAAVTPSHYDQDTQTVSQHDPSPT